MSISRKLIYEVLLCSLAATVTAFFVIVGQFALEEVRGPAVEGRSVTVFVAFVAACAFPLIFVICVGYSTPVVVALYFASFLNVIHRMKHHVFPALLLGFILGILYWALIDLLLPWYPANRDRLEIKLACYLGSGVGVAIVFMRSCQRLRKGERECRKTPIRPVVDDS